MKTNFNPFTNIFHENKHKNMFYNDKIMLLLSILMSVIIWIAISFTDNSYQTNFKIDNIPIDIQLSDNALNNSLTVFLPNQKTASVEITGNALSISKVSKNDIEIDSQQASSINQSGTYELSLTAKNKGTASDFYINQESLFPLKVTALVDRNKRVEFTVKDDIGYRVDSNYFASSAHFTPNTIVVSGPESIVSKIVTVAAKYNISNTLSSFTTVDSPVVFYDKDNNIISDSDLAMLTISQKSVQCDISVLKKITTNLKVNFIHAPISFDYNSLVKITPSSLDVALPETEADNFKEFTMATLDFSKINISNNKFDNTIELPQGYKNLSNISSANISLDMDRYKSKTLTVNKFEFSNLPQDKSASTLTTYLNVEVNGTEEQIDAISSENVTAVIDLSEKSNLSGHTELPVTFKIEGYDTCWIYGTYNVSLTIS